MIKILLKNIKQILLIVFSVVLGIFLSERIEDSKNKKEAALLLSKIKSEVNENKELVAHWTPYHNEIVNRLDSLCTNEIFIKNFIDDESVLFKEVITRGTLMTRSPSSDAWDIAKSHPLIVHFEYEDLLILSKIYNQQAMTYESVPKVVELLLSTDFNTTEKAKPNLQAFKNLMWDIVSREKALMNYFKEADKTLELQKNQENIQN